MSNIRPEQSFCLFGISIFLSTSAFAESKRTNIAYAKINVNGQISDEGEDQFTEIRGNNSWIGVKGKADIEEGLYAVYRLGWKVNITSEKGQDTLTQGPQYVGIGGKAGEITLGRHFTALWMAQGGIDLYDHYEGDMAAIWKGANHLSDVATYTTPKFSKFSAVITYQAEKEEEGESAVSAAISYGDSKFKSSPLFASLAHDFDVKGYDVTRASIHYKVGPHKIGGMVQRQEPADMESSESETGALVSYSFIHGKVDYRFQYQTMDEDKAINVGFDYRLSKATKFFAWVHGLEKRGREDSSYIAVGFEHRFSKNF